MKLLAFFIALFVVVSASDIYWGNPPAGLISTQISRANTPGCSYGPNPAVSNISAALPPLILSNCTEAIAPTAVDMRGLWLNPDGTIAERIEQCGQRIIIIGGGVIHDTVIADGSLKNGVNDISYYDCSAVNIGGKFFTSNQSFVFFDSTGNTVVSRQKPSPTTLQLIHPIAGVKNYTLATAPTHKTKKDCLNWTVTKLSKTAFAPGSNANIEMDSVPASSFSACTAVCKANPICLSFIYVDVKKTCWLTARQVSTMSTVAAKYSTSGYLTCTSWSS